MTVLYVLISTDPYSGSTKSFMILLKGVLKAGINVIVVSPDNKGIYPILCDMGVKVFIVPSKGNTWTGTRSLKHKLLFVPRQLGRLVVNFIAHRKMIALFHGHGQLISKIQVTTSFRSGHIYYPMAHIRQSL